MKIGIITAHFLRNYGSVLQAYALKTFLESFNYEVKIIDYLPDDSLKAKAKKNNFNRFSRLIKGGIFFGIKRRLRTKAFNRFREENFNLTSKFYGYEELKDADFQFDAYICGSDQIWNPLLYGGFDRGYFLKFTESENKISYAPSIRVKELTDVQKEKFIESLSNFKAISVREKSSVELLNNIINKKIHQVLDPTLLLTSEQWANQFARSKIVPQKSYGVVYETHKNLELEKSIKDIKKELDIDFFNISNNVDSIPNTSNKLAYIGPKEFISLIQNARFVITNSFHCIVFCIQFNVPFLAFQHENDDRFNSILEPIGLESRILSKWDAKFNIDAHIENKEIQAKLNEMRIESIDFLINSLGDKENGI